MRNLIGSNPASDSDDDDDDDDNAPPSSDRRMAARTADAAPPAPGYDDAPEINSRFAPRALSSDDDDDDDDFSPTSLPVPRDGADAEEEEEEESPPSAAAAEEETDDGCCRWGRARTVSIKERSSGVRTMPRSFPMMARQVSVFDTTVKAGA